MSLEIIGLRECRPPTSRSESDLNTEFGPTRLGSVQRGSSGGAVPSPAVSQYSDELRRPALAASGVTQRQKSGASKPRSGPRLRARPARNDRRCRQPFRLLLPAAPLLADVVEHRFEIG